jgi:hypothetical protein
LPSGGVVAEGSKMNFKPKTYNKTFFALALMLTISLMACTQFTIVNAQTTSTITINNGATYTNSTEATLTISATNATEMCFSNDNATWSSWENYTTTKNWTIPSTEGTENVYAQFRDSANQTAYASTSIILDVTPPVIEAYWSLYSTDYKTVYFDAYYSTDNYGIKNASWSFGDGNFTYSTYAQFTHTYSTVGNYNVTLTLIDVAGNSASKSLNVTVPDASTIATPTPAPTVSSQPTFNPTEQPTAQPTSTAAPSELLDPLTMVVLVGAIGIIAVVILAIILVLRRKPKQAKPQQQQSAPSQAPPPQHKPSEPSGPSESNFTI